MIVLRLLPLLVVLAGLTSCAGIAPLPQVQRSESTNIAHASVGTELQPDVKNPKRMHALSRSKPRPATTVSASAASASAASASAASASAASGNEILSPTTPSVGSPQWEKEKAYNERKEQKIKQVIDSICRGC
jgi:predicted lipid-binding transport protein (Tim44 family)